MILSTTLLCPPSPSSISIISTSCDDVDVDDDDDSVDYCCCSPHHLQAQRLNNTAATCIENGQATYYEKAITILTQALRMCEKEEDQEHEHAYDVCSCHYCSIDGCIDINDDDTVITEDNNDGTILYQNPIFVYEGHHMASSLIHIISFNLAIVHHLTATKMTMAATTNENENENSNENSNENDKESFINKALQFYELAYECNLSNTCSVRFDTIICNNLSHMYRSQEQQTEEQEYQEKLQEQNEEQEQPQPQRIITAAIEDEKSVKLDELLELEYYSHEEEQEEYAHHRSLISLLTTTVSTTTASSTSTTTTSSPASAFTKTGIKPQPQRITAAALEDEKSVELEELLELEYYSHEEEQEEYAHNRSLISLLTTAVSTTMPSSSTTTSTISSAPSCTKTISSARTIMIDSNEGFLQNVVSSSSDCSDCNKSSSLLFIKQHGGRGGEVCGITDNHDSIQSLTYATCA